MIPLCSECYLLLLAENRTTRYIFFHYFSTPFIFLSPFQYYRNKRSVAMIPLCSEIKNGMCYFFRWHIFFYYLSTWFIFLSSPLTEKRTVCGIFFCAIFYYFSSYDTIMFRNNRYCWQRKKLLSFIIWVLHYYSCHRFNITEIKVRGLHRQEFKLSRAILILQQFVFYVDQIYFMFFFY